MIRLHCDSPNVPFRVQSFPDVINRLPSALLSSAEDQPLGNLRDGSLPGILLSVAHTATALGDAGQ